MRKSLVPAFSTAVVLCFLFASFLGLDFQDEGFALNSLRYPYAFSGLFTRYAYIYQYLYGFAGQNIPILRMLNIFVFLLPSVGLFLAPYLIFSFRQLLLSVGSVLSKPISTSFVLSCLSILAAWPFLTPTYGHAAFIGCLLVCYPVLLTSSRSPSFCRMRLVTMLVGAFGIYLLLLAKLPTALLVIFLLSIFALLNSLCSWHIAVSIVLGVLFWLLHGSFVFSSPFLFLKDIQASFLILSHYESSAYSPVDLISRIIPGAVNAVGFLISFLLIFVLWNWSNLRKSFFASQILAPVLFLLTCSVLISVHVAGSLQLGGDEFDFIIPRFLYSTIFSIFFCLYLISVFSYFKCCLPAYLVSPLPVKLPSVCLQEHRLTLYKAGFFGLLSFAFAAITTNSFYEYIANSSLFFVLGIFSLLLSPSGEVPGVLRALNISFRLTPFVVSVVLVSTYMFSPFSHKVFSASPAELVYPGETFAPLLINKDVSSQLKLVEKKLELEGFYSGTPVLDLTTMLPGLQYFIGAKPVGWPWILGYAPGATDVAGEILRQADPGEIYSSWLIVEKKESDRNSNFDAEKLLKDFGLNTLDPSRYEEVTTFKMSDHSGHRRIFSIFKPLN